MNSVDILGNFIVFFALAIIFILVLYIYFKITLKKYDVNSDKVRFYGLFLGMDNRAIISFSMITLNFIFFAWLLVSFVGINWLYISLSYILVILATIISKQYNRIFFNILFNGINCLCVFIANYIYNYFINDSSLYLLIILALVIIFVFLYLLYITFKWLNEIITKNKYLIKKQYKKI